jgi:hypothetical protein
MAILGKPTTDSPEYRALDGSLSGDDYVSIVVSKDASAREAAARSENAPVAALVSFAQDSKSSVRLAVASNPAIGRATSAAAILADDRSADVVRALVDNPATPDMVVSMIADRGPRSVRAAAQERLAD